MANLTCTLVVTSISHLFIVRKGVGFISKLYIFFENNGFFLARLNKLEK